MWYYMQDGAQQGPISEEELQGMASDGRLQPTDMVWKSGMQEWQQANQVASLPFSAPSVPEIPAAPSPGVGDFGAPTDHSSYDSSSYQEASSPREEHSGASYGAQATTYGAQGGAANGGSEVPDYLVLSIIVTLFCCNVGGIGGIIYSVQANSAKKFGNLAEAQECAKKARKWLTITVGLIVAFYLIIFLVTLIAGIAEGA